jgi:inner membrane protein
MWSQLLLFSVFSVAALLLFRRPILRLVQPDGPADVDSLVGEIALPVDDIAPGAVGRAELRGTVWAARNHTAVVLAKGQRCRVVSVDRLMLFLEPEGARA